MSVLALLCCALQATLAAANVTAVVLPKPWQEQLRDKLVQYPPAKKLLERTLDRLSNPYELQPACWKDSSPRGRGLGRSRCDPDSEFPEPGGALCYRRCRPGYTSDGVTMCWKSLFDFYTRGAGVRRSCQADEVEQSALCYEQCPEGFVGVGPVCWQLCSATAYPFYAVDYGAMCCATEEACKRQMFAMAVKFPALWAKVVVSALMQNYAGAVADARLAIDGAMAFALPICGDPIFTPTPFDASTAAAAASVGAPSDSSGRGGPRSLAQLPAPPEPSDEPAAPTTGRLLALAGPSGAEPGAASPSPPGAGGRAGAAGGAAVPTLVRPSAEGGATCVERAFGAPARTCAEALRDGSSCAELVTAGYDCHCTCVDREVSCWKHWAFRGVGRRPRACDASSSYPEKGTGVLCYQRCLPGFRSDGASQCHKISLWPPGNTTVYSRGSGADLSCAEGEDKDAGLCYPRCPPGFSGAGPVCWSDCDAGSAMPINGGAICCSSAQQCGERIINLATGIPFVFADVAADALTGGALTPQGVMEAAKDMLDALNGFKMPLCGAPLSPPPPPAPPGPPPGVEESGSDESSGPASASALAVQHVLQLLPAKFGSAAERLALSADELAPLVRAELAALLGADPTRFQLDMFQPAPGAGSDAPSWWERLLGRVGFGSSSGRKSEGDTTERAILVVSMLPAPSPAPAAWQLSASFLERMREALAAKASQRSAQSLSGPFDRASMPLLSRAVVIESALSLGDAALQKLDGVGGALPDFSPVVASADKGLPMLWADLLAKAGIGTSSSADEAEPSPLPPPSPPPPEPLAAALPARKTNGSLGMTLKIALSVGVACLVIAAAALALRAYRRSRHRPAELALKA